MTSSLEQDVLSVGLPWWFGSKESVCNAGDPGLIHGSGRSPGGRNGDPLQYSCLENPMDRGAWQAAVHGVARSQTQLKQLNTNVLSIVRCQNVSQVLSMDLGENCDDDPHCFHLIYHHLLQLLYHHACQHLHFLTIFCVTGTL